MGMQTRKRVDYSSLSVKKLKVELNTYGVNTDAFLEKSEFVKALEDVKRNEKKKSKKRPASKSKPSRSSCKSCESKFTTGEKVLYVSGETSEYARILEVHWTEGDAPFYIVRLDGSGREKQTDDAHLVALKGKSTESSQTESGKTKKAMKNMKHSGRKTGLSSSARSSGSTVESKSRSLPPRASSFPASLHSRKKDELSSSSTHSTSSSRGSRFSFFNHKPKKPARRSAPSKSPPEKNERPSLRPARLSVIGYRPIKTVRRTSSMGSSRSQSSSMSSSLERPKPERRKTRSGFSKPASASGFATPKTRCPPARASSFPTTRKRRVDKRHTLRPSPSQ